MSLPAIAQLGMALEENVSGAELGRQSSRSLLFHCAEDFCHRGDRLVVHILTKVFDVSIRASASISNSTLRVLSASAW